MVAELAQRTDGVVTLRRPELVDGPAFVAAALRSSGSIKPWVFPPETASSYDAMIARVGPSYVPSVLVDRASGDLLGALNLSEVVRGNFMSAYLGYYAFEPHQGRGLMARGLKLLLAFAFEDLALHRVEANVQPANERSVRLLRAAGFEHEGFSRNYLFINGAWRDHERFAMRRECWIAS
jgi:ribosomal-protein-alanine N-acetyltransferase